MSNFKSLRTWTIVLNFFILVGVGHGLACLGLLELVWTVCALTGHHISQDFVSFSFTGSYEQSLCPAALLSFLGQAILLFSFTIKEPREIRIKLLGLSLLWVSYCYLIHNCLEDSASQLSFFSGIPFLISSGLLTYRMIKERSATTRS
jgi:hypothetical protein